MQEAKKQLFWAKPFIAQYLKLEICQIRNATPYENIYMQMSELRFIDKTGEPFEWPAELECVDHSNWLTTSNTYIWNTKIDGGQCAECLLDNKLDNKFCTWHHKQLPFHVTYDFKSKCLDLSKYGRYQWFTCDDDTQYQDRAPQKWNLYLSENRTDWVLVDAVEGFNAPVANNALAYTSGFLA